MRMPRLTSERSDVRLDIKVEITQGDAMNGSRRLLYSQDGVDGFAVFLVVVPNCEADQNGVEKS